jgi:NADH-quinone oxidoreductase subunit M
MVAAFAGLSIIFSAVYTLNMIKNVFYGEERTALHSFIDIKGVQILVFVVLTALILLVGFYPAPFFKMFSDSVGLILTKYNS